MNRFTELGLILGCKPTPRVRPAIPERCYYSGPPLKDNSPNIVNPWEPNQERMERESRRERARFIQLVSRLRKVKHA